MTKTYKAGDTIAVAPGHERVPEGDYVVLGIGNDVSGNDPAKYPKIYECKEVNSNRLFHIHQSDLEEKPVAKGEMKLPEPEPEPAVEGGLE